MRTMNRMLIVLGSLVASVPPAHAATALDPANPEDRFRVQVKMYCSLTDGVPTLYWWSGSVYARVPGEPQRKLFGVQGMNMRQCTSRTDPVRGFGYRSVSREVMFYLDPKTGEVLRTWTNPWTGKDVEVVHVANDPVNARDWFWSRDEDGKPLARGEGMSFHDGLVLEGGGAARLFYRNPLAGDYQEYVGGTYHAMEFGSMAASAREALDADNPQLDDTVLSWGRISNFLPWMEMGGREGVLIFHTAGMRLDDWSQLPAVVRDEIARNHPTYRSPPPLDDARPNETSWTVFKRFIDGKRAAAATGTPDAKATTPSP
jgi:hypothetical protein